MPHITLETSSNVKLNEQLFFKELSEKLVATGHASQMGIKCRVVSSDRFFIIDGDPKYQMVNLLFRLREGRTPEVLEQFSKTGMDLMKSYFSTEIEEKTIILSTEIKELITDQDLTFNGVR